MLIGLHLPQIVEGLQADGVSLKTAITYGILVTVILTLARIVSSYVALIATLIFRPRVAPIRNNRNRRWKLPLLLGWTGMRGVVSLAQTWLFLLRCQQVNRFHTGTLFSLLHFQ